jgi:predicted TIM-barrel fold metal-dependent hydrolase
MSYPTRRQFIASSAGLVLAAGCRPSPPPEEHPAPVVPIIDIHQHTGYHGRTDQQLLAHQVAMGVTQTMLLPAGKYVQRPSTHNGLSNGLAAHIGVTQVAYELAGKYPGQYFFFANEVPDLPEARQNIEKYLKLGAFGIGEQKFNVDCDSAEMNGIAEIAQEYRVPILMHIQHDTYNKHFERFYKMLEKYPTVRFIGHAQTFWANVDKDHADPTQLYPKTKVKAGGLTDRYLSDYPNMYADMSAGSGLNSLLRDEDHARGFLERHQNKLLFGSDCCDPAQTTECQGQQTIAAIRRLAPSKAIERKILYENALRMFPLTEYLKTEPARGPDVGR